MRLLVLAFLSGVPALLYEVVWTREVALLAGSQVEAIALVLVAFFGGLAAGAALLGPLADRTRSPLRLYAGLELPAGLLAAGSPHWLRPLGAWTSLPPAATAALAAASLLPIAFLLGGTLPALLRAGLEPGAAPARRAGRLVAANTAGAVAGVATAVVAIPQVGLVCSISAAGAGAVLLAILAALVARPRRALPSPQPTLARVAPRAGVLIAAGLAGIATLGFEVLTARLAALHLGSSLLAWGLALGGVLAGLALGGAAGASRAASTRTPERDLGLLEAAAALSLGGVALALAPALVRPAGGLALADVALVALATLAPAVTMGAAFPFFVRLAVGNERAGAQFGATSGINTGGGIAGSLLASFVLLPMLGPVQGLLACAGLSLALALVFLRRQPHLQAAALLGSAAMAAWVQLSSTAPAGDERVVFARHGAQGTAAVVHRAARRDLYVDGDPEASTGGSARETEELLALLPLVLHPDPQQVLEVGLGSGITLGTAARFPVDRLECVEIAEAVRAAAPYFAPANRGIATGYDPRVEIRIGDGRAHLARRARHYDVILANTLHPWSVGATGLYSREYFDRMAAALRPGGIAAQWLPTEQIGGAALAAIVGTFFESFPHGGVWWGADNLILLGSDAPLPAASEETLGRLPSDVRERLSALGLAASREIHMRRVAGAGSVRHATASAGVAPLRDDRPRLERLATTGGRTSSDEVAWLVTLARTAAARGDGSEAMLPFLESRVASRQGDHEHAVRLLRVAREAGLALASRVEAALEAERGRAALQQGAWREADAAFQRALARRADEPTATLGRAAARQAQGDSAGATASLERLVAQHPDHAEGWRLLAALRERSGEPEGARRALQEALHADPWSADALLHAGLMAARAGDAAEADLLLRRLEAIERYGPAPEAAALRAALASASAAHPKSPGGRVAAEPEPARR